MTDCRPVKLNLATKIQYPSDTYRIIPPSSSRLCAPNRSGLTFLGMNSFQLEDTVYPYPGPAGWFFVRLGDSESRFLKAMPDLPKVAWGYVRVTAKIGKTTWKTTLFPSKEGPYLLAIKAEVRKKEKVKVGDRIQVQVTLDA